MIIGGRVVTTKTRAHPPVPKLRNLVCIQQLDPADFSRKMLENGSEIRPNLGGGFKHFLFLPLLGEMIQFDEHIFQMG